MATVKIEREKAYFNKFKKYKIVIDGMEAGEIVDGKLVEFTVEPGIHSMIAKVSWCSSSEVQFEVKEGNTRKFRVTGPEEYNHSPLRSLLVMLFFLVYIFFNIYLICNHEVGDSSYLFYMLLAVFLFPLISRRINSGSYKVLYYTFVKRAEYLKLSEVC
ncbi:hypothetical protein [Hymenobacter actinosclerus]|uniref:hypothetical protein n=1 Tax=Hymenobacter actinosclerus TaxID=82805 RepID=UPI0011601833|nr:hypothetical protein [Hymenobacter actinosclerus]